MKKRKCSVCKSTEHRADYHGSAREREALAARGVDTVPPDIAMRSMIIPEYALWLVSEGRVGEAVANCALALAESRKTGVRVADDTMVVALAELDKRSRKLTPEEVTALRELRRKRDDAEVAYMVAAAKITEKLGYPEKKS